MLFRQTWKRAQPRRISLRPRCRPLVELLEQRLAPAMKGLADFPSEFSAIQPSWTYNWGTTVPTGLPGNIEYVPMTWNYTGNTNNSFVNKLNQLKATPGVGEILGFNEPDLASQANMTVAQALDGWQYLSALGIPVISPAAADDSDTWMRQFMSGAAADGYRIDAVALHWYGGDNPSGFIGYVDYIHSLYNKPIWITEFAVADFTGNNAYTPAQAYDFMSKVIPQLDARPYVLRYCWFPTVTTDPDVGMSALFNTPVNSLTAVGQLYAGYDFPRTDWTNTQVGNPGVPGSASFAAASGTWTVSGSGTDIGSTSDQFTYVAGSLNGDGSITTEVNSLQNTDPWAKAGVMFRSSEVPDDAFADVVATPGNGVAFAWRTSLGGSTSIVNVTGLNVPVWTRLTRSGNNFSAYYSSDGVTWKQLGTTQTIAMSSTAPVGLAVTSHNNSVLTTATFTHVSLLPSSWTAEDIGSPGLPGLTFFDSRAGTWTVSGGGGANSFTADPVQVADEPLAGDGSITALVTSLQNTDPAAKAGVMFRDSDDAGAAFADVVATPGNGVAFQWRNLTGGDPLSITVTGLSAPVWTRLERSGSFFFGYYSTDGVTWKEISSASINMKLTARAGLAVTSHTQSALATATFAQVSVLPLVWNAGDIGSPGLPGSALYSPATSTWTVTGSGADIWGTADQFQFVSQPVPSGPFPGDTSIQAQVTSLQSTDPSAKAGIMFRNSNDPGAVFADVLVTPGNGVEFEWRASAATTPSKVNVTGLTAPVWTRLVRSRNSFSAFYSTDGVTWKQLGGTQTISMNTTALAGLVVCAHNNALLNTATFADVSVAPISFTMASSGGTAGTPFPLVIHAVDASGNFDLSYTGSIQFINSAPARTTILDAVTGKPLAGNLYTFTTGDEGEHAFFVTTQTAGSLMVTITDTSVKTLAQYVSVPVNPGPPVQLGFAGPPAGAATGVALPPVSVQVLDRYGNVVTTDNNDQVTLGIASGPGPGAPGFVGGSTTTALVQSGIATFNNLTLATPGSYTLSAAVPGEFTGPNSAAFQVAPLQVMPGSFVDTPSGFSLQFNAPYLVTAATPVLYGQGFGAGAPVPSVTLTQISDGSGHAVDNPIAGSLVLDQATNSLTFVATDTALETDNASPILPDGTYAVDLTSSAATDGFQTLNSGGGFLDGLGAGIAGSGDYRTTFTITAAAAHDDILWVPASADGPGQPLEAPGNNQSGGGFPIYLSDATGTVTSVQVTVNYDPTLLTVTGVTGANFSLLSSSTPGQAVLQYSGPALPTGTKTPIGFLTAQVPAGSTGRPTPYRAEDLLHLSGVSINGGAIAAVTADGLHLVAYVGDADGNGSYTSNDAALITRVALQTDSGFAAYPLVDPVIVADIDGSGFIPADAALQINEAGVGAPTSNLPSPPIPSGVVLAPPAPARVVAPTASPATRLAPVAVQRHADLWFQALDRGALSSADLLQSDLLATLEESATRRGTRVDRMNRHHS